MKKLFLILACIATAITVNAQKVALHTSAGVQHFNGVSGFQNAYIAASPGDTIYLPGGGFLPPANIEKSLVVFGAGHYPDFSLATSKTIINGTLSLRDNADGFHLEGVDVDGDINFNNNESINNVTIKYCRMNNFSANGDLSKPSSNLAIINCVLSGGMSMQNIQDGGIYNTIIQLNINYSQNNIFENNIIMLNNAYSMYQCNSNIINNNIFINSNEGSYFLGSSNQINNNIMVQPFPGFGTTPVSSGNYFPVALNNIFVTHAGYTFDYANDYHLQAPGTYLGTDGTQVGIYGGIHSKAVAVPSNPHFLINNIAPSTDNKGDLNIKIQVEAQDK